MTLIQRLSLVPFLFAFSFIHAQSGDASIKSDLLQKLKNIDNIDSIVPKQTGNHFIEKYEIYFTQLLDPKDSTAGFFQQRIFLSHTDFTKPMVFITEGYTADYGDFFFHSNELATMLNCNQILAEHRYFGKSWPDSLNWEYLTVENAARDHHVLINTFKELYKEKWISTGISKGGQTSLIHMSLYPEDVDFSVPYVAPLNFGLEDGRHEPFINQISTAEDREKLRDFQLTVLKKRDQLFPGFEAYCNERNYTFRLPLEEIYDYCVLEFSFAFWQWGYGVSSIPTNKATDSELFDYLMLVSSPSYFALEEIEPTKSFFVQAYRQMGYYGYDTEPFKEFLKIKDAKGYLKDVFLPEGVRFDYDSASMQRVQTFIEENDPKMIFIYGEFDPWSATAVEFNNKKNMFKLICASGSHASRISTLSGEQRKFVKEKINEWLNE